MGKRRKGWREKEDGRRRKNKIKRGRRFRKNIMTMQLPLYMYIHTRLSVRAAAGLTYLGEQRRNAVALYPQLPNRLPFTFHIV